MPWPELPPRIPRVGNALTRGFCRVLMGLARWRVEVSGIPNEPRMVIVVAPHTSNWDWVLCILAAYGLGLEITWLGKHTLFQGPLAWFFYGLGGIPVNRKAAAGIVDQVVAEYERREKLAVGLAPEGTRKPGARFRTGYHRIAKGAGVPVVLTAIDYRHRRIVLGESFPLTDDADADTERLAARYQEYRRPT